MIRIPLKVAAAIAGLDEAKVRVWLHRGHIDLSDLRGAGNEGRNHAITLPAIEKLAIVAALNKVGVDVKSAWQSAGSFYISSAFGWGRYPTAEPDRAPGELFRSGRTILVRDADGRNKWLNPATLDELHLGRIVAKWPAIVLPVDEIIDSVRAAAMALSAACSPSQPGTVLAEADGDARDVPPAGTNSPDGTEASVKPAKRGKARRDAGAPRSRKSSGATE